MGMSFQTARDKARVKQAILRELSTLPRPAQEDVLADIVLTYEDDGQAGDGQVGLAFVEVKSIETFPASPPASRKSWKVKSKRGRPTEHGSGRTAAVEAALRTNPGITIAGLTKLVYPDEEDASHRIRAILWSLKKQGRANNPQPGKWEVTATGQR